MAINIKFDLTNNPEPPTIVLAKRNGDKLGQLKVDPATIELNDKFNDASEMSFTLYKYTDGKITNLWNDVVNFKLVYCKEWDMWFEITVELDEETKSTKTVFCTQLGQAELSQLMLYDIHINEEGDSNWDIENKVYKSTILYNPNDVETSLLHRLLKDKAPHYSIIHVDSSIAGIQRTFSFDGTSIYDAFMEIAEEVGCLFIFHSNSDNNGKIQRTISVYDLQQKCQNVNCGHRGEFVDVCPKCGSTDIRYGYGEDTTIFITADELASEGIQLQTDTDAVKNCFKLEAGDDLMTATVRNCNPNGTDYIWYFSDDMKSDMSKELVDAIESYDEKYKDVYDNYTVEYKEKIICENESKTLTFGTDFYKGDVLRFVYIENNSNSSGVVRFDYGMSLAVQELNNETPEVSYTASGSVSITVNENVRVYSSVDGLGESIIKYNALVDKYFSLYNSDPTCIDCKYKGDFENECPVCGSTNILEGTKLQKIPTQIKGYPELMNAYYNVVDLALFLESGLMPKVEIDNTKKAADYALLLTHNNFSSVAVNVEEIKNISLETANSAVLSMVKVIVPSTFKTEIISSSLSDSKMWTGDIKVTNYSDEEDVATSGNISIQVNNDTETFVRQKLEKSLNKDDTEDLSISGLFKRGYNDFCHELTFYGLKSLKSFYDSCETCLVILTEQDAGDENNADLYNNLYLPYTQKQEAIAIEMGVREKEIVVVNGVYNKTTDKYDVKGLRHYIEDAKKEVQKELDFESHIGKDLWLEFCSYRREDKYSNDNYISDGLNNAQLFDKAKKFINVAEDEIFKSAELQHSISSTLNNLLAIEKFKPLVRYFSVGNWMRVRIDDEVYKLRLLDYSISYGGFNTIPVTFSDVTKVKTGISDIQSVLAQASSMATSYNSVQKQAEQGNNAKGTINQWLANGLNSAQVRIQSNTTEDVIFDRNGLLCRSYNEITDTYEPEQFRITHNIMAFTNDNWKTTSTALGKHNYVYFDDNRIKQNGVGYGLTAKFVTAGYIVGSQMISGNIFSENYSEADKSGSHLDLTDGTFSFAGGKLVYNGDDLIIDGKITVATEGTIACWNVNKDSIWKGSESYGNANGMYFGTKGLSLGDKFSVSNDGILNAVDGSFTGIINAKTGGIIGGFTIGEDNLKSINNTQSCVDIYSGGSLNGGYLKISGSSEYPRCSVGHHGTGILFNDTLTNTNFGAFRVQDTNSGNYYSNISLGTFNLTDNNSIYTIDLNGNTGKILSQNNDGSSYSLILPNSIYTTGSIDSGKYIYAGTRIYLNNNYGIRGLKCDSDYIANVDNSNCIAYVNTDDRVVLGNSSNTKATEIRSPSSVFLKCGGIAEDESRYTLQWIKLNVGTELEPKNRGVLRPVYKGGETTAYSNLGSDQYRWKNLYITSDAVITSDKNLKKNINSVSEQYIKLFDYLNPVTYQMIDGDRIHMGFISQDVEDAMNQVGLTAEDFGGFCKDIKTKYDSVTEQDIPILDENGNYEYSYSLRYGEFIALNTAKIKQLEQIILELKNEIKELKS